MKKLIHTISILLLVLISTNNAFAHDPSKHKKMATKPKCEAMASMNTNDMDANDPVLQAMMKKCESVNHHHEVESETKPAMSKCTAEHAEMGHCTMDDVPTTLSETKPPAATCTVEHAEMGHCTMSKSESAAQSEN